MKPMYKNGKTDAKRRKGCCRSSSCCVIIDPAAKKDAFFYTFNRLIMYLELVTACWNRRNTCRPT